jgi:hypothetical protein
MTDTVALRGGEQDKSRGELLNKLQEDLRTLPDTEIRQFERDLPALIRRWAPDPTSRTELKALLEELVPENKAPTSQEEKNVRYKAVYMLCMLARRDHRTDDFARYLGRERREGCASYHHLRAMRIMSSRSARDDMKSALDEARWALDMAEEARREVPPHVGIQHHFGEVVVTMAEADFKQSDFKAADNPDFDRDKERARKSSRTAVRTEASYAKFHATEGRWLAHEGDYDGAEAELHEAIRLEPEGWDRPYRYADYRTILAGIGIQKQRREAQAAAAAAVAAAAAAAAAKEETGKAKDAAVVAAAEAVATAKTEFDQAVKLAKDGVGEAKNAAVRAKEDAVAARDEVKGERQRHAEMLGFFAGILAIILTGVRYDPGKPVAMILGLLALTGVLLVAYGALALLMHEGAWSKGSKWVLSIGAALLAVAVSFPLLAWVNEWKDVLDMLQTPSQQASTSTAGGTTGTAESGPRR